MQPTGLRASLSRLRILEPVRRRDFALLTAGSTVSLLGDGFHYVALAWQVYAISNVPTALSVVGVAGTLPMVVLFLVGGLAADRFDRRRLMVAADLVRAAAIGSLGLLSVSGVLELWHVVVLIGIHGSGLAFFYPASTALVPQLVPEHELAQANALRGVIRPLMVRLIGPAAGGVVVGLVGPGPAFLVDAATFLASAVAIAAIAYRPLSSPSFTGARRSLDDIAQGVAFVRAHRWIGATLVAAGVSLFFFEGPLSVLLPFLVRNELKAGPEGLGVIFAAGGAGSIVMSLAVGQRGLPSRNVTVMYLSWALGVAGLAVYGVMTELWQPIVATFAMYALFALGEIIWVTLMQRLVPGELLGRVSSLDAQISWSLIPVSFALTGPASALFGPRPTIVGGALIGGLVLFSLIFVPGVREPETVPLDQQYLSGADSSLAGQ